LTVEDQIKDADLHLLSDKYSRDELRPNLTAFLAISRGVIDHLLEEYNMKFGLNIPLEKKLNIDTFEKGAKRQNNQPALRLINFFKCEFDTLTDTPLGGLMFGKRNIVIHRTGTPLHAKFLVNIPESINLEEKLSSVETNKNGNIRQESQSFSPQQNKQKDEHVPSLSEVEVKWFFIDNDREPHKEVTDTCREFLDLIRDFVDKVHKKYP
jgi:hypothetical protein